MIFSSHAANKLTQWCAKSKKAPCWCLQSDRCVAAKEILKRTGRCNLNRQMVRRENRCKKVWAANQEKTTTTTKAGDEERSRNKELDDFDLHERQMPPAMKMLYI